MIITFILDGYYLSEVSSFLLGMIFTGEKNLAVNFINISHYFVIFESPPNSLSLFT